MHLNQIGEWWPAGDSPAACASALSSRWRTTRDSWHWFAQFQCRDASRGSTRRKMSKSMPD